MIKEKYSEEIMEDLRQRRGLEREDTSQDKKIMEMSKDEALDEVATWNGLIGYGNTIKTWIEEIYGIELE